MLDTKKLKPPVENPSKIWAAATNYKRGSEGLDDARGRGTAGTATPEEILERTFLKPPSAIVGLEEKSERYPKQVSGGEQQRVAIARALIHRPKILVADEPTGNLDSINTREIADLLLKINEFGTTVILVSHNRELVNSLRRRVVTLEQGTVISDQEVGKYVL